MAILVSGIVLLAILGWQYASGDRASVIKSLSNFKPFVLPIQLNISLNINRQLLFKIMQGGLVAVCIINIAFVLFANVAHLAFPFHLNLKEGTLLQHLDRLMRGLPVYPEPSPGFVPLAYNIGYYLLTVPVAWVFGVNLFALRLVAMLGNLLSALLIYRVVRHKTQSKIWGLVALGLFAAAYGVMESYLDTASSDSWLLCLILLGTWLISQNKSKRWNLLGLLALVASFWVKQHGALFVLGGLGFLFWRDGWRAGLVYALVAAVLGPVLYIFVAPMFLGSHYHYFTWTIPRGWSELNIETVVRFVRFIVSRYLFLALVSGAFVGWLLRRKRSAVGMEIEIWHMQWVFAVLSGFLGMLDPGSANNVLIPMETWFIIVGVWGAHVWLKKVRPASLPKLYKLQAIGLIASFGVLLYNPFAVIPMRGAPAAYQDFTQTLNQLDGQVYAPYSGFISSETKLYPNANWIALEDMVRRPSDDGQESLVIRQLLREVTHPKGNAYLVMNAPIGDVTPILVFLGDYYVLEKDFGSRFEALGSLPDRYFLQPSYPRYLYRHNSNH